MKFEDESIFSNDNKYLFQVWNKYPTSKNALFSKCNLNNNSWQTDIGNASLMMIYNEHLSCDIYLNLKLHCIDSIVIGNLPTSHFHLTVFFHSCHWITHSKMRFWWMILSLKCTACLSSMGCSDIYRCLFICTISKLMPKYNPIKVFKSSPYLEEKKLFKWSIYLFTFFLKFNPCSQNN